MRNLKDPDTPLYWSYEVFEKNLIDAFKGGAQVEIMQAKIEKLHQGAGTATVYFTLRDTYNNTVGYDETTYPTPQARDPETGAAVCLLTNRATDHLR
jgi:hypothetical protein